MAEAAPGLIAWLTVRNHRFSTGRHWRRGVFLEHRNHAAQALFTLDRDLELHLTVRAQSPDYFFSVLRDTLEDLIHRRWKGLDYELLVPCPTLLANGRHCTGRYELQALEAYRIRDRSTIDCRRCYEPHSVTELLTGFKLPDVPLQRVLHRLDERAEELKAELHEHTADIKADQREVAAETANQIRILLRAVTAELPDCPRLFTLLPTRPSLWQRVPPWKNRYRLTLWCEHPGYEHPWAQAAYEFTRPMGWFRAVAPYALVISRLLRVAVPISGAVLETVLPADKLAAIKEELDLMMTVTEKALPGHVRKEVADLGDDGLRSAEGGDLRALRVLLVELDSAMRFGDLRRVLTPSGDYLWSVRSSTTASMTLVCPRCRADRQPLVTTRVSTPSSHPIAVPRFPEPCDVSSFPIMDSLLIGLLAAAAGALAVAVLPRRQDSGPSEAIGAQLTHMQSQLDRALSLVGELERGRAEQLGMLSAEIRYVHRQGAELADATRDLREALVSTKARGQWGERMAEDVLRLAGLIENVNYRKQKATRSGSVPDFTFLLRADLHLHMDVKFPFDNYVRFTNTGDERYGDAFLHDVRARVRELAARDYIDPAGGTVDFVLMFIPNDQLLTFIQEQDPTLIDDALRHKVVCCSPLSLFPVLQVVRQAAEGLQLEHNIAEIHSLLGAFAHQWDQFTKQLEGLGTHLERAQRAYEDLITTRRRTLERPLEKLNTLRGARQPAALTSSTDTHRRRA